MNTAWISLLKKDLRLAQPYILAVWALIIAAGLLALMIAGGSAATALLMLVFVLHVLYPAAFLSFNLTRESHITGRLWLHNPHSGWFLLSARWSAALLSMLPSLLLTGIFTLLAARTEIEMIAEPWTAILAYGWIIAFFVVVLSIYTGAWFQFIWMATAVSEMRSRLYGVMTLFLLVGLYATSLTARISPAYQTLVRWGTLKVHLPPVQYDLPFLNDLLPISIGESLFYLLVVTGLGLAAARLLDHQLEV